MPQGHETPRHTAVPRLPPVYSTVSAGRSVSIGFVREAKRLAVKRFDAECVAGLRVLVDLAVLVGRRDLAGRMRAGW